MAASSLYSAVETGAAVGLLPLALAQSARVTLAGARAVRCAGPRAGSAGEVSAPPLRLLVVGDATAIGGGAGHTSRSLGPRVAYGLALRLHRRVHWQAVGGFGWRVGRLDDELRRRGVPPHDLAFVTPAGVNDALRLTSSARWRRDVERLRDRLFEAGARLVAFSGLPAARELPGFRWPLDTLVGHRVGQLDRVLGEFVARSMLSPERSLLHVPVPPPDAPFRLSRTGLLPSSSGYAFWARHVVDALLAELAAMPRELEPARLSADA